MSESLRGTLTVEARGDLEIVMTRTFDAPRERVFDAFTRPEHIRRWLGREGDTMTVCEIDLRPGGRWRHVFRLREGGEMGMGGEFLEVERPSRLGQTEAFEGENFEAMGGGSVNTLVFEEHNGKTALTMTIVYRSRQARDAVLQTPMEQGLGESFERLDELLASMS